MLPYLATVFGLVVFSAYRIWRLKQEKIAAMGRQAA
jgi:hypothetical protein